MVMNPQWLQMLALNTPQPGHTTRKVLRRRNTHTPSARAGHWERSGTHKNWGLNSCAGMSNGGAPCASGSPLLRAPPRQQKCTLSIGARRNPRDTANVPFSNMRHRTHRTHRTYRNQSGTASTPSSTARSPGATTLSHRASSRAYHHGDQRKRTATAARFLGTVLTEQISPLPCPQRYAKHGAVQRAETRCSSTAQRASMRTNSSTLRQCVTPQQQPRGREDQQLRAICIMILRERTSGGAATPHQRGVIP